MSFVASGAGVHTANVSRWCVHPLYICSAFKLSTYIMSPVTGDVYRASLAIVVATTGVGLDLPLTFKSPTLVKFIVPVNSFIPVHVLSPAKLGIWSCISTKITGVHAIQLKPVHAVAGTAVLLNHLVNPVIVVQLLPVKLIHSS